MTTNYHNTNNLRGEELKQADKRAGNQSVWVKGFFQRNPGTPLTPSAVKRAYDKYFNLHPPNDVLLTSIRRAMSDLTKGRNNAPLRYCDEIPTTKSPRGGKEGYWMLNTPEPPKESKPAEPLDLFPKRARFGDN